MSALPKVSNCLQVITVLVVKGLHSSDTFRRVTMTTDRNTMTEFARLVEEQIPRLRRYARALMRTNPCAADDLVQETLARAVAKQHLWEPGTNLRAWLFTLMHNQHVNDVRRAVREGTTVDIEDMQNTMASPSDTSASALMRDLDRGLTALAIEQRQVILLVGLEGLRYEEVAVILGVPIGTVRSRLSRGRDALRKLMGMEPTRELAA
jgi:RNA polymerase sigma-70 factor, ECF subfamily